MQIDVIIIGHFISMASISTVGGWRLLKFIASWKHFYYVLITTEWKDYGSRCLVHHMQLFHEKRGKIQGNLWQDINHKNSLCKIRVHFSNRILRDVLWFTRNVEPSIFILYGQEHFYSRKRPDDDSGASLHDRHTLLPVMQSAWAGWNVESLVQAVLSKVLYGVW